MSPLEIVLIIVGVLVFLASFLVPEKGMTEKQQKISQEQIKEICEQEAAKAIKAFEVSKEERMTRSVERAKRELEKISNEKIMAVGEYSDTVLAEIDKTHKEVIFLHSMMCDKEKSVKDMLVEISQYVKEMEQIKQDIVAMSQDSETLNQLVKNAKEELDQSKNSILQELDGLEDRARETVDDLLASVDSKLKQRIEAYAKEAAEASELFVENSDIQSDIEEAAGKGAAAKETEKQLERKKEIEENLLTELDQLIADELKEEQKKEAKKESIDVKKTETTEEKMPNKELFAAIGKKTNKRDKIIELQKGGSTDVEIAKQLGIGTGEVKLVLGLYSPEDEV